MALRVVLIQSEMQTAQPLTRFFSQRGDEVWQSWELGQAWELIQQVKPHLILMDLHIASPEWVVFLRRLRQRLPDTRVIMTNKYPDLQREILAREQNVQVFLRQPFSERWIEQALKRLADEAEPAAAADEAEDGKEHSKAASARPATARTVRVPVRVKITLPYLLLALIFALGGAYLVSRVVLESVQDRFLNQLIATGKQSADWMVGEEDRLLTTLRLIANTQGTVGAVQSGDSQELRRLILPLAVNAGEEAVDILDARGISVLSMRLPPGGDALGYTYTQGGDSMTGQTFVRHVLARRLDSAGDKFAGVVTLDEGDYFYVSGPILDGGGNLAGVVLVGKSLQSIAREMHADTLGEITLYDGAGQPLVSTLYANQSSLPVEQAWLEQINQDSDSSTFTRDLTVSTVGYTEILGPWDARGERQGVLGVSLAQAFLARTSRNTQLQVFVMVAVGILLVLLVGVYLANLITRPLLRLVKASGQVAQGNLEIKVDASGDDEVAVLAQSFNYMVAGLQEGSVYRDLLGRTVSPEVREQLRQTFNSGNLRLEGQQAVTTVLMTDIRGFTAISEKADPATVFQWLNEYFAYIVPIVAQHGGVVNKFDGDAMLAFFGILPSILGPEQSAAAACETAVEILKAVEKLNRLRASRSEPLLITGVGVNTGVVMAGGLGTSDRLHYTIIGDTVNTTQRIESLTRDLFEGGGALISQSTYAALTAQAAGTNGGCFDVTPLGERFVKGKAEPLVVYQIAPPAQQATVQHANEN